MAEVNMTFRVDDELKAAFMRTAKDHNRNASLLLRDFMQDYIVQAEAGATPRAAPRTRRTAAVGGPRDR